MDQQVRVASDRRGEVQIVLRREREVTGRRVGVVNRLLHGSQEQVAEQRGFVRAFDSTKELAELLWSRCRLFFELVAEGLRHLAEHRDPLRVGLAMDSKHAGRSVPLDVRRNRFVGHQHHVLDDAVCLPNARVFAGLDDFLGLSVLVEDDFPLRKVEIERAAFLSASSKPLRKVEQDLQCLRPAFRQRADAGPCR